ncbi:MAG: hypothetical protein ACREP7_14315 [Lysobacter sp.]
MIVGTLWLLVLAFMENILWGVIAFFVPPALLVFAIMHWDRARIPFLLNVGGIAMALLSVMARSGR